LSPIEFTDALLKKIKSHKKFVVYEGERHAIGGNNLSSSLGENWFTMLADWCLDRIEGKPAPNERVFINGLGEASAVPYDVRVAVESRRAAALDRRHHLQLAEAHMASIGFTPSGPVVAEDVRDLQNWTDHQRRASSGRLVL